jgi:hypothetical protein
VAVEAKATKRPLYATPDVLVAVVVCEIEDCPLAPFPGVAPSGVEIRNVSGEQVLVVVPSVVAQVLRSNT